MTSQIRSKQPRPLSIIDESSLDDYTDNSLHNETAINAKESKGLEKQTPRRPTRRISVAPIEHPVIALSQEYYLRDNSANSGNEKSETGIPCTNSERKIDVLEHGSHSDDSAICVQKGEAIQNKPFSKNGTRSKQIEDTGAVLPPARLADQSSVDVNVNINNDNGNKHSKFTDQQTNSELGTRMYKNILNDLRKSEDKSSYSNSFGRRSNEQRKLWFETHLEGNEKGKIKCSEANNVSKEVENTNYSNVDCQKLDIKEVLSQEQQAWRNTVRKSSSFTFSSVKVRPLRRSMGSFDFKNPSFLGRNERSFKKGDNMGTANCSNENVKFYLSSDVCEDKKTVVNVDHLSGHKHDEHDHPRELSVCGSHSWNGLCSIPRDGSSEQSSNVKKQSSFMESIRLNSLPNMGKIVTNQQTQKTNSESGELSSDTPHYKSSNRSNTDSQSNSMLVRRISAVDQSDLRSLQALATRLNLPTRRLSTTIWREKYLGNNNVLNNTNLPHDSCTNSESNENHKDIKPQGCDFSDDGDNDDGNKRLNNSLALVREDLVKMRLQDQTLARQFLKLRHKMLEIRLAVECQNNMELLDGAQEDVEMERELSKMVDIPSELMSPHYSLLHVGLTKMNFTSRRFSTC